MQLGVVAADDDSVIRCILRSALSPLLGLDARTPETVMRAARQARGAGLPFRSA